MADDRSTTDHRREEVRAAHARGWAFCRLNGKAPIDSGWQRAERASVGQTDRWAQAGNVGLRTGSISGIAVIDDDTEDGSGTAELHLPRTVTVQTGSGKRHYYFCHPIGGLKNSVGRLAPHVDVRADGGQVVFVGSVHPDTGRPYKWVPGLSPSEIEIAKLPEHLLERLRAKPVPAAPAVPAEATGQRNGGSATTAQDALDAAARRVGRASEGSRNDVLNRQAFRVGKWVGAGLLPREHAEAELLASARSGGLPEGEARATLRSGLDAGIADPNPILGQRGDRPGPSGSSGGQPHERPVIVVEGGVLPANVDDAEKALLADGGEGIYQRGTLLVRALRAPAITIKDVYRRSPGILILCELDSTYLAERLTRSARWLRVTENGLREIDCPERIARTYLARKSNWKLPRLIGVIEAPTLRPDGSILDRPGYDPNTCLLFDPGGVRFPRIPLNPTREDALAALQVFHDLLRGFPWLEPSDRSAAIAAILTALVRHSLRSAPLTAFRAPKMASGKSLLADVVAMVVTGRPASVMSQGKDEDEDKKRMLAILVEGITVACIDNIERPFGGAALCSVLTSETWRDRILGKTGTATVPTATTWLATGNNIEFVGDITTRVVISDLDPRCEKPEERKFDVDLHEYVPAHRGEIVAAGLTILRAFHIAGRPAEGLSVFGRFEQWSGWIRASLVWLGEADPCAGRRRMEAMDPVRRQLRLLLMAWHRELGSRRVTAGELTAGCSTAADPSPGSLALAVLEVASGNSGRADGRRLGRYLARYERRPEAGLRVERIGDRQGVALWRVVRIDGPPDDEVSGSEPVGLEGLVGSSQPVAARADRSLPAGSEPRGESGSSELNPRNPRNPRDGSLESPPSADSGRERQQAAPARLVPCGTCGGTRWWTAGSPAIPACASCFEPPDAADEVEFFDSDTGEIDIDGGAA